MHLLKRFIGTIVALIFLVGFLRSMTAEKDGKQATSPIEATVRPVGVSPAPSLPAASPPNRHFALADIAQAYRQDEASADKRFRGRRFGVSGLVENVRADSLGLFVENMARVRAKLDAQGVSDARAINAGQSVVLSCVGAGTGFYAVELVDCHVVTGTLLIPRDKPPIFSPSPGLPEYHTTLQCIASNQHGDWLGFGSAADWRAACYDGETSDKGWLVNHWSSYEPKLRANCLAYAADRSSYSALRICLQVGGI